MSASSTYTDFLNIVREYYPSFANLWEETRETFGDKWEDEFNSHINHLLKSEKFNFDRLDIIHGYAQFCTDAVISQIFFEKNLRYKSSSYQEMVEKCYTNEDFMNKKYLPGQFIAHFIWPHHYRMLQFFREEVIGFIEKEVESFYEVGVGCGMYSLEILKKLKNVSGIGIDISDHSLDFTSKVIQAHELEDRYNIKNIDINKNNLESPADLVVSQEVLEHLEDPQGFLKSLNQSTKNLKWCFVTAAINAGHTDHIYLYRSPSDVEKQINECNWKIVKKNIEYANTDKPLEIRPTIAGYLLKKI